MGYKSNILNLIATVSRVVISQCTKGIFHSRKQPWSQQAGFFAMDTTLFTSLNIASRPSTHHYPNNQESCTDWATHAGYYWLPTTQGGGGTGWPTTYSMALQTNERSSLEEPHFEGGQAKASRIRQDKTFSVSPASQPSPTGIKVTICVSKPWASNYHTLIKAKQGHKSNLVKTANQIRNTFSPANVKVIKNHNFCNIRIWIIHLKAYCLLQAELWTVRNWTGSNWQSR